MSKIQNFYDKNVQREWERLGVRHRTEYAVTMRALIENLPSTPATVIDIGGGPGRYALALTENGYEVTLIDLSEANLAFASQKAGESGLQIANIQQADAMDLSAFPTESFDAALMMGPLYHLLLQDERVLALQEAWRLLKSGGVIFAAFLSRFGAFRDAASKGLPWILERPDLAEKIRITGIDIHHGEGFTDAYFAHPDEVIPLGESAGFETILQMGCEGVVAGHETYVNSLNGEDFESWADLNYRLSQDPAAIGASDHILYIGRKPGKSQRSITG
jgi:ubiquinone/menaquinone biosynthesis C-methylase UbiE